MKMEERSRSWWLVHDLHVVQWCLLLVICRSSSTSVTSAAAEQTETYIIRMDPSYKPSSFSTHESWHHAVLDSLPSSSISSSSSSSKSEKLIYSYNFALHGFSARLTPSELSEIEKLPAHRATHRERYGGKLFTTRTPKFLGLTHYYGLWPASSFGRNVIVGIIDSGIWPESESFNDRGFRPVPARWKGACENGSRFSSSLCNRKLIGARSFNKALKASGRNISSEKDYDSPRDFFGHGTHTASTAAGSFVQGVDYFGYAKGTAKGLAPYARLAIYKVHWATDSNESTTADVLAGIDQAIADEVDILSISLGFGFWPYYDDVIAIGALSAVKKGIFVACAAGNGGSPNTTYNGAPWITTVGAGTIDRVFLGVVNLRVAGHGCEQVLSLKGTSYYPVRSDPYILNVPLYLGKNDWKKARCLSSSLVPSVAKGKVILCDLTNQTNYYGPINEVKRVLAKAAIFLMNGTSTMDPPDYSFPIVVITSSKDIDTLWSYAMKETNPVVKGMRFGITEMGTNYPAPQVAYFSSRGPDPVTPTILKPDILAPGKDILAAWVPNRPFVRNIIGKDDLATNYGLFSGTSMASPHVAGVAALLRSIHREWTPAAIRSAIMTTASTSLEITNSTITDEWTNLPASPLEFGAGHVNPNRAMDPGLVYDMGFKEYLQFLCTLGYNRKQLTAIHGEAGQLDCNSSSGDDDLNYPSFMAVFTSGNGSSMVKRFTRDVTNIGTDKAVYRAIVDTPKGMTIQVIPRTLTFTKKNQTMRFWLRMQVDKQAWRSKPVAFGFLKWVDRQNHNVSSPLVAISH